MATVHLTIGGVMASGVPSYASSPEFAQTIASSGTSQASSITSTGRSRFCSVTALGAVWVAIGPAPVAQSGTGYLLPSGTTKDFSIDAGDKIAVMDAT